MATTSVEEFQKELTQVPQRFYYSWLSSLPTVLNAFNPTDSLDKTLELQQELIKNYLAAQEIVLNLALSSQKQWWDIYFDLAKKAAATAEPKDVAA